MARDTLKPFLSLQTAKKEQLFEDFPQCVPFCANPIVGSGRVPVDCLGKVSHGGIQMQNNSSTPSVELLSRENPVVTPLLLRADLVDCRKAMKSELLHLKMPWIFVSFFPFLFFHLTTADSASSGSDSTD